MMTWLVCEEVPAEYVPMLMEEMELDGTDARRVEPVPADARPAQAFPVVVIGCGQSGLLAGIRLKEAGIPFTIVEKNAGVGGTWWENSYPGARVDVGNHFYCYSFEPSDHWTEFFAQQPELQAYFEAVMTQARHRAARPLGDRGARRRRGTTPTAPGRCAIRATGRHRGDAAWPAR